ncbi:hypothetical protein HPB48_012547 [Haemaphysalis longicornis]|uniref:long-chain-fatty-acid--CoA ligase n=1 Tax=Haemaphysalis longicornis TaxID=44386 RepID=A0A9J6GKS0_HAELO|nr:hypothetical protein HPB48_012547 [Haemaphysalis longicornis]
MSSLAIQTVLAVIKVLVTVYDVITLPIYIIIQRPWIYWQKKQVRFAKPIIEGDPSSPYKRPPTPEPESLRGLQTLDEVARKAIRSYPKQPVLGTRPVLGRTEEVQPNGKVFQKYEEADRKIDLIARGLLAVGARPHEYLAILAETRVEWMLTAQACFRTNVPLVTMYTTLSNDAIVSAVNETEVTHMVTSSDLLPRVLSVADKMPSLTHIVYMVGTDTENFKPPATRLKVIPFSSLDQLGADYKLPESAPTADDVAIVMFTSGSLGKPKGVMATHKNLIASMSGFGTVAESFKAHAHDDTYIAYLPLAHMLELSAESILFGAGARIGYSSPLTLTDKSSALAKGCRGDITLLQPTLIACVPLILERVRQGVSEVAASRGPFFKAVFDYAVYYKNFWLDLGFATPLLDLLIFRRVSRLLGGKLKFMACGSAPLSNQTRRFVRACVCCQIVEGYGCTETSGAATIMDANDTNQGHVGAPLPGCYIRLIDWAEGNYRVTDKPNPRGEIVVGGPCVSKGYFKNDELTREFYREGRRREVFPDGTLKIIDRKKDLIKLQFGEYISLGHIESILKTCPLVDNVFAYGDSLRTYLVALVAPNLQQLQRLARDLGKKESATLQELCDDAQVSKAASESILSHATANGLQKSEVPRKVKLCPEPWSTDSGLVTATYKIRRKPLQTFYQRNIDALYG